MKVKLAYGRSGLEIDVPDSANLIQAPDIPGLADEKAAIRAALRKPIQSDALAQLVKKGDRVAISHTDITRATPNDRMLPVLLAELEAAGIQRSDITLINALGTHRPQTPSELRTMLGEQIVDNYRCIQHNAFDDTNLVSLGKTSYGHPVRINRMMVEADVKLLTGFIEPHFFAGFSGGPKAILPALAGAESVLTNHGVDMVGHPNARWGVTKGNPVWEEMCEMALNINPTMLLNVTMNTRRQITGVFAGDMLAAHNAGCDFARTYSMIETEKLYDIVITTNSGYPLDQNLYQSSKGLSAGRQIVRKGGAIVLAAACEDGLPDGAPYIKLLEEAGSVSGVIEMMARPGFQATEQWQLQIQAEIQSWADVYVYSDGLTEKQIESVLYYPCKTIPECLNRLINQYGSQICILPEGPLTIPYLKYRNGKRP